MASADYDRRPADIRARQRNRKKKACQRCRTRKQRCDGKEPTCHNCATSGSECIPAKRDELALYPVAYINSLSQHVMNLESRQVPQENLEAPASQPSFSPPADRINNITAFNDPSLMDMNFMTAFPFQSPQNDNNDVQNPTFPGGFDLSLNLTPTRTSPGRRTTLSIPLTEAASHFQTYIDVIHPRYPVLTVEEYAQAYLVWKERGRSVDDFQKSWHLFVATMILGIGSRIHQPYNSRARRAQHEMLISHIESSDGEISDPDISPLSRLQAKLLNLIFVLLGDSTSRLVHVSGVVMRFATLHQFHRLEVSDQKDELDAKVRAWSCIYTIDRMISATLRIPVCVSEAFISSPLYDHCSPTLFTMPWLPWLQDCPEYDHEVGLVDLSMFIHMCKFRHLQSKITCASAQLKPEDSKPFITSMLVEIKDWERQSEAFVRGKDDEEGYFSSLWLRRGCAVLEVQLYSMYGIVTATATAAEMVVSLFNACCATCHAFRKVQKSHQLAPQWIDTIFEFQAGVTLLYLIWSKNIASQDWQAAERAVRDCRSTLVILATVAPVVESFINCIDALVTMVFNETQNVPDTAERKAGSEQELQEAMQKAIDAGVAPHIRDMLHEMSKGREII